MFIIQSDFGKTSESDFSFFYKVGTMACACHRQVASLRSARQAHACIDSDGRRTEKRGRAEMPAEPLWAFLRFSPSRLFSVSLRTLFRTSYLQIKCNLSYGFSFPPNLPFRLALSHNPPESKRRKILVQMF